MRAAVLKVPGRIVLEELPEPVPDRDQVVVEVSHCGVCGSDIRYFKGENPWALHTLGRNAPNPPNIILGHEFCGRVVKVGSDKHEHLLGENVVVIPYDICGTCPDCLADNHHLCQNMIHIGHGAGWGERPYYDGGMAQRCRVWAKRCFPVPKGVNHEQISLVDLVGVALHASNVAAMEPGHEVAVIGCGPVGMSIAQIARSRGAREVYVIDRYNLAIEIASQLSFTEALNATEQAIDKWLLEKTHGLGVKYVWDTVGSAETLLAGIRALAKQGSLINLALHPLQMKLNPMDLAAERKFCSSSNYRLEEFPQAIDLVSQGVVNLEPMITHRFSLDQVPEAMEALVDKEKHSIFKAVINI